MQQRKSRKRIGKWLPKKFVLMIICLFPFFPPQSLNYTLQLPISFDLLMFLWRTMVGLCGIVLYLQKHHFKLSKSTFGFVLFCGMYALMAFSVTSIKLDYTLYFIISVIGIACLLELFIKAYDTDILKCVWAFLFVMFIINTIYMFLHPEGVYQRYVETFQYTGWHYDVYERFNFIGGDNGLMFYGLPLWFSGMLLVERGLLKKKWFIASVALVTIDIVVVFSVTSLIGIILLDTLTFMLLRKKPLNLSWPKVVIITVVSNIFVVGFGSTTTVLNFVERLFSKALTLSIRGHIWRKCFEMIIQSPLVGYGNKETWYQIEYAGRIYAPHNIWLCVLIQGGVILLLCFIYLLRSIVKGRESQRVYSDEMIACATMLSVFIMGTAETLLQNFGTWFLFGLIGASKYLRNYKNGANNLPAVY